MTSTEQSQKMAPKAFKQLFWRSLSYWETLDYPK